MEGFYKVAQEGGTYIVSTFYNPTTKEVKSQCVRDYDYSDGSRDNDELYYMPINEEIRTQYLHFLGIVLEGDKVRVVKGRKMPIGYEGTVKRKFDYKDRYGRLQAIYVVFEDGQKTNVDNVVLVS